MSRPKIDIKTRPLVVERSIEAKTYPESLDWLSKGVISAVHSKGLVTDVAVIVGVGKETLKIKIPISFEILCHRTC